MIGQTTEPTTTLNKYQTAEMLLMYARRITYALRETGRDVRFVCEDGRDDTDEYSHAVYFKEV